MFYRFIILTVVSISLLAGCSTNSIIASPSGRIVEVLAPAPSLEGNLLGDPIEQHVAIYLPPGYENDSKKRYPVLYLLHGFTGTQQTWLIAPDAPKVKSMANNGYQWAGFLTREILDQKITSGDLPPMIIVAPNGRNAFKHSFYVNSPVTGNWEDYIVEDVVNYIDKNYRTLATAKSRGIAGHSGGGNGALYLAMRHSDIFGAIYAMSPCCLGESFSLPFGAALTGEDELGNGWRRMFLSLGDLKSLEELPPPFTEDRSEFWMNTQIAAGAAFAPNPDRPPFYGDYLFEAEDGKIVRNESAIQRRKAHANYYLLDEHEGDLRNMQGILIDFGEFEEEALRNGNAQIAKALAERSIPFTLEVYPDGYHSNLIAQRMESHGLAFFAKTLQDEAN